MSPDNVQVRSNLEIAREMYETVLARFDTAQLDRYFAVDYVQHGSLVGDGREKLRAFLDQAREQYPDAQTRIVRSFVDGDHVIFHVRVSLAPSEPDLAVVDIFRMEDGLMAEHWEVIQPVANHSLHANRAF